MPQEHHKSQLCLRVHGEPALNKQCTQKRIFVFTEADGLLQTLDVGPVIPGPPKKEALHRTEAF